MRSPGWAAVMVAVAGAGCTAYPAAPTDPAYDVDVRPLLMAHCVRCHGAGGTLNVPTEPTGQDAPIIPSIGDAGVAKFLGYNLYLDIFDSTADKVGAGAVGYPGLIAGSVLASATPASAMPPAPAPRLNDWEVGMLQSWAKNAVCSNSAVPDPAICPNGPGKAM